MINLQAICRLLLILGVNLSLVGIVTAGIGDSGGSTSDGSLQPLPLLADLGGAESGMGSGPSEQADLFMTPSQRGMDTTFGAAPSLGAYPTQYEESMVASYSMQAPPPSEKGTLVSYSFGTSPSVQVYYQGTYYPWSSFYGIFPGGSPALWVSTATGWSWNAYCPLGGWVRELMYIPRRGSIALYEIYPSGLTRKYDFGWSYSGYKYIWFNGDATGKHITIFTVNGEPSNAVVIDVGSSWGSPGWGPSGTYGSGYSPGGTFYSTGYSTSYQGTGYESNGISVSTTGGYVSTSSDGTTTTIIST